MSLFGNHVLDGCRNLHRDRALGARLSIEMSLYGQSFRLATGKVALVELPNFCREFKEEILERSGSIRCLIEPVANKQGRRTEKGRIKAGAMFGHSRGESMFFYRMQDLVKILGQPVPDDDAGRQTLMEKIQNQITVVRQAIEICESEEHKVPY